jgi:hypothetical protein
MTDLKKLITLAVVVALAFVGAVRGWVLLVNLMRGR